MTSPAAASRKPWFKKWWVWAVGIVVLLLLISAIGNLANPGYTPAAEESTPAQGEPASFPPAAEELPSAPATPAPATPAGPTDDERNATAFDALRTSFGGQEPSDVFASDPSLWYGWISGTRVDGGNFYVTLQVAANDAERKDLGERAAAAITNLITGDSIDGLSWVIVEDASGVVIDQKAI